MILTCYQLLKRIEPRPAMYTGEHSLKSIHTLLLGYTYALRDHNIGQIDEPSFHDWIQKKFGYYESTAGWANMILAQCMGYDAKNPDWNRFLEDTPTREQHIASVKLFYKLMEEFKTEAESDQTH